jgi:flagellar hook-associated protein 3 FlgL
MRIATNTTSEALIRQIQSLSTQQSKLQTQVASGQSLSRPSDDPAAAGRVLILQSESRALDQYRDNADRALEVSQATYGGIQQLKKLSDRATELGTLGTGALSADQSSAYAAEVDQLLEQAVQLGNSRLRNDYLFAGSALDTPPYSVTRDPVTNAITAVSYAGDANQVAIRLSETASITPGADPATTQGLTDFLNRLVTLRDTLRAGDSAAVSAAEADLIASEDVLVDAIAQQGAIQTRIEVNRAQQIGRADDLQTLVSGEVDADLPTLVVRLSQAGTAYQAALQSAANIMRISLLDYIK